MRPSGHHAASTSKSIWPRTDLYSYYKALGAVSIIEATMATIGARDTWHDNGAPE